MGGRERKWEGGGQSRELQAQKPAQAARRAPFLSLVASVNQLQGPHVLRLDWDRKPLAKAVVPTKVGSREYGYGRGHRAP